MIAVLVPAVVATAAVGGSRVEPVATRKSAAAFTPAERAVIASLSLQALPRLAPDPTNRMADDPSAAAFGATLFFEQRLSRDGNVACSTCHLIDRQFQDDRPRGIGVGTTTRRTMPLAGVAHGPWFFWDGRRDSLWAQALAPLEDPAEHAGNRTAYAHFIARTFRDRYERIFGPLPDLSRVPAHASPLGTARERTAWQRMSPGARAAVDRVFSNLGKALAAFERSIAPEETRFDRFAKALGEGTIPEDDAALSEDEMHGLRLFIGKARCVTCHSGPRFTDDKFHNTGIPAASGEPADQGRQAGIAEARADPFNCLGEFSDATPDTCRALRLARASRAELAGAFKTPSLRGAAARPPYMHAGQIAALEDVIDHYARAPSAAIGVSELQPLALSARERAALIAFLKTLAN